MSEAQLKSLVLIPKFTGGLSMLGSSIVCWDILREGRTKLRKVYHRLLFVMSFMDVFLSLSLFLSTWPIPKDTEYAPWLAAGNDATCTAQGFAQVFFMPALFYNAYLSIYYVLVIVYGWKEHQIVPLEKCAHCFSLVFACVTAFTALALDMYGSNFFVWCFITGSWNLQLAINIAWQWAAWVVVFVMMGFLCWKIGKQLRTQQKYGEEAVRASMVQNSAPLQESDQTNGPRKSWMQGGLRNGLEGVAKRMSGSRMSWTPGGAQRRKSTKEQTMRLITSQAALYSLSYLLTESSNIAVSIAYYTSVPVGNVPIWVLQYALVTIPLQGFWNCIIYFRPRFLKWREKRQKKQNRERERTRTCTGAGSNPFSFFHSRTSGYVASQSGLGEGETESGAEGLETEERDRGRNSAMLSKPLERIEDVDETKFQSCDDEADIHSLLTDQYDDEADFHDPHPGRLEMPELSESENPFFPDEELGDASFAFEAQSQQPHEKLVVAAPTGSERTHNRIDQKKLAAATDAMAAYNLDASLSSLHWTSHHVTRRYGGYDSDDASVGGAGNALEKPSFDTDYQSATSERRDDMPSNELFVADSSIHNNNNGGATVMICVTLDDSASQDAAAAAIEIEEKRPPPQQPETATEQPVRGGTTQPSVDAMAGIGSKDSEESFYSVEPGLSRSYHDAKCE